MGHVFPRTHRRLSNPLQKDFDCTLDQKNNIERGHLLFVYCPILSLSLCVKEVSKIWPQLTMRFVYHSSLSNNFSFFHPSSSSSSAECFGQGNTPSSSLFILFIPLFILFTNQKSLGWKSATLKTFYIPNEKSLNITACNIKYRKVKYWSGDQYRARSCRSTKLQKQWRFIKHLSGWGVAWHFHGSMQELYIVVINRSGIVICIY